MSTVDKLARTKPKENAGSRSSNRFEYQINWGLNLLLKMEEANEDYIMILDYHDDIVVCNYVFNVIPKDEHKELLELLKALGKEIYISVRSDVKAIKPSWVYCEEKDVYITTSNTYQRFYTELVIKDYFGEVEFIVSNNSFRLFRLIV